MTGKKKTRDPRLAVEPAIRARILGYPGIFFQGQMRTVEEIMELAGPPIFPLAPFTDAHLYPSKLAGGAS